MNKRPFTTLNFLFSDNTVRSQSPFVPERWIHQSLQGKGCFARQQWFFKIQFVSRYHIPVGEQHRRAVITSPSVNSTAERTVPFSSLTLPLHGWTSIRFLASASKPFTCLPNSLLASSRKKSASGMMSSRHSRSGGMCNVYSLIRWNKS